jgi:hypothetical protein
MISIPMKKLFLLAAGSAAWLSSTSKGLAFSSYVDSLTESKTCAAAWTWQEYLAATFVTEPNNCEMVEQTVLDENGELQLTISQETEEFVIATSKNAKSIESAVTKTLEMNFHRNKETYPEVTNPQFLDVNSRFYQKVMTPILYPPEAILPAYGKDMGDGECAVYEVHLGPNPSRCKSYSVNVDIYGVYRKLKYTLPTKKVLVKKDAFCSDSKSVEKSPARYSMGRSDIFMTLDQVKDSSYESIGEKSIQGAERYNIVCPHGVTYDTPSKQAQFALNWLKIREQGLDLSNQDVQAVIKYLKALALEKASELTDFQLSRILELHKKFPAVAFGGQETDDNAAETSPEDALSNRALWAALEKKMEATPKLVVALNDLRSQVENNAIQIHKGDASTGTVGKGMNFPEVYYTYSSFGYTTSYLFLEDGSITVSTRGGSLTHAKGSTDHAETVAKIKQNLQAHAAEDLAAQDPSAKRLIDMLFKYLNEEKVAVEPQLVQDFKKLSATLSSKSMTLYSSPQSYTNLSFDANRSEITFNYQGRFAARSLIFTSKGLVTESWGRGSAPQSYEPGQDKHTEIANQVLADINNWRLNRTDLTPELIQVYDDFIAYLESALR